MKLKLLSATLLAALFAGSFVRVAYADTAILSGSVKDSSGGAIVGATVIVNDANNDSAVTDNLGNYTVSLSEGTYNVQVAPPAGSSFAPAIAYSQTISVTTTLNFVLVAAGTASLHGYIYDESGAPVANQSVYAYNGSTTVSARTDTTGGYSLQGLPGTYKLTFTNFDHKYDFSLRVPGYYTFDVSNFQLNGDVLFDVTLPARQVNIHVQDVSNAAVSGVKLTTFGASNFTVNGFVTSGAQSGYSENGLTTDTSGNATLWLFPSSYTVTATPPASNTTVATTSSSVAVASDTSTNITMKQVVVLSGHIYDESGTPASSQSVYAYDGSATISASTDSNGVYALRGAAGTYRLTFTNYDHKYDFGQNVPGAYTFDISNYSLTQDTQFDVTLPARQVNVHVQDAANNPIAGAKITESGSASNFLVGGYTTSNTQVSYSENGPTTDASGSATLWLLPGTYRLTATPPANSNYASASVDGVAITNDAQQTITLSQPVTLSGRVSDELGNPIPNQTVVISSPFTTVGTATTDATGSYSVQVASGTYKLDVTNFYRQNDFSLNLPGYYDFTFTNYVLAGNTELDFTVPARKVSLHIQDNLGNSLANIKLTTNGGGDISGISIGGMTTTSGTNGYFSNGPVTDASGDATMWLLPATYTIVATPPSGGIYAAVAINNVIVANDQSEIISLQYSHNPPVTTVNLSPAQNSEGAYSDPTSVSLIASAAAGYTIADTYYTVDGGAAQVYGAPFIVSGVGVHTINYWSVDNSGVQESHKTDTFTIASRPDAPSLTIASPTQYPILVWNSVTGASSYSVYRNGTEVGTTTSTTFTDYLAQEGTNNYYVTATGAGGESLPSNTVSVLVDRTAPTITYTVSPNPNANSWNNTRPVTITFNCADNTNGSGIDFCSSPVILNDEGANQIVTGTAVDDAGNSVATAGTINIDTTVPTVGMLTLTPNVMLAGSSSTLSVPAADTLSGIVGGEYFVGVDPGVGNATPIVMYSSGMLSASFGSTLAPGVYAVGVRSQDAAGNWSVASTVMLTIYDTSTALGISGADKKGQLVPSTSHGDFMPGLTTSSTDGADYGFTVQYKNGVLDSHNAFTFTYTAGGHSFNLAAVNFAWMTIGGTNNSQGWFQGIATLTIDGVTTTNPFYVAADDGDRTSPATNDSLVLKVYAPGADPSTASPIYRASGDVVYNSGNGVKIH